MPKSNFVADVGIAAVLVGTGVAEGEAVGLGVLVAVGVETVAIFFSGAFLLFATAKKRKAKRSGSKHKSPVKKNFL